MKTGNFLPKNRYGWIWGIFYPKIRIWMDMDPAERGGVEWVSEFCPVKGSNLDVLRCISIFSFYSDFYATNDVLRSFFAS